MVARLPLRAILRDMFMIMCGSFLGLLLSRGFVTHDLRASDMSEICGAVKMTKRSERSKDGMRSLTVVVEEEEMGNEGMGAYPYQGYAGSGPAERSGWDLEAESGGEMECLSYSL